MWRLTGPSALPFLRPAAQVSADNDWRPISQTIPRYLLLRRQSGLHQFAIGATEHIEYLGSDILFCGGSSRKTEPTLSELSRQQNGSECLFTVKSCLAQRVLRVKTLKHGRSQLVFISARHLVAHHSLQNSEICRYLSSRVWPLTFALPVKILKLFQCVPGFSDVQNDLKKQNKTKHRLTAGYN